MTTRRLWDVFAEADLAPTAEREPAMTTETAPQTRLCPACEFMPAAPGDRYCEGCGSAADRSAWADGYKGEGR